MRVKDIDFPEELLDAQIEGKLVIFAGAGVSAGPPSNYPSFEELAAKIAEGSGLAMEKGEPPERFLGRLQDKRVRVHHRCREILSNPDSKPNALHCELLKLFGRISHLRLVTTNFDSHFTDVAKEQFGKELEIYCAPALPVGSDFRGLVYIHGSVEKGEETLVLTDRDFGRAYLTEGWARRFLQEVFGKYMVLFVGYSHNDTVINYLARGLPPDSGHNRYALTKKGELRHWEFLNIVPVTYPLREPPEKHKALQDGIGGWATHASRGALGHEQRIRELVTVPPPLSEEDSDYLEWALKDIVKVRFFTRHAKRPEWLKWAEERGILDGLFDTEHRPTDVEGELARWIGHCFVSEHEEVALDLIRRKRQTIGGALWQSIAHELAYGEHLPNPTALFLWVRILIQCITEKCMLDFLGYVLRKCRCPEDNVTAITLFECLTKPQLVLKEDFQLLSDEERYDRKVDGDITIKGSAFALAQAWEHFFLPNLPHLAELMEPAITENLTQANLLLRPVGHANEDWDPSIFYRPAIETQKDERIPRGLDILINAGRDVLNCTLKENPRKATTIIDNWGSSGIPLLKRLAVWGIDVNGGISHDEKIKRIIESGWLFPLFSKHEVFELLKKAYPESLEATRRELLHNIKRGPQRSRADEIDENLHEYQKYNLLHWLRGAAPKCPLASEAFEEMQRENPSFKPRETPDMDFLIGTMEVVIHKSPISKEQLLEKDPQEAIELLLTFKGGWPQAEDREGLLGTLSKAVIGNFEWSWSIIEALAEGKHWEQDIWHSIIEGWRTSQLANDQWIRICEFLRDTAELAGLSYSISTLLNDGIRKGDNILYEHCLDAAESLADQLVDRSSPLEIQEGDLEPTDWLGDAINHTGGRLAEFWLRVLEKKRQEAKQAWEGIPDRYEGHLAKIVAGNSEAAELGRVFLASQVLFLFDLDADWTRNNILQLFDWSDCRQAWQVWQGYLVWGRWSEALLEELLPLYEASFEHLGAKTTRWSHRFCEHLARIAIYRTVNPVEEGWLMTFVRTAHPDNLASLARDIGHELRSLREDVKRGLWDRWLKEYWSHRIKGVLQPLTDGEKDEMILWSTYLEPVFTDVVDKICQSDPPKLKHTMLYRELSEGRFAQKFPDATTKLLQHLLSGPQERDFYCKEVEELVRELIDTTASRDELRNICERLAGLGCLNATKLSELCGT